MYVARIIYYIVVEVGDFCSYKRIDFYVQLHHGDVVTDGPRVDTEEVGYLARSEFEELREREGDDSPFVDFIKGRMEVFTTTVLLHFDFDDVGVRSAPPPHRLMNQ